jgi:hypothetical protein
MMLKYILTISLSLLLTACLLEGISNDAVGPVVSTELIATTGVKFSLQISA